MMNRMSQGNSKIAQQTNENTDSCNESFAVIEPTRSETLDIFVSLEHEPYISVSQRARKWPNILLGEAFLNIEQQKLDYLKQKHARKSHVFDNEGVYFLTLPEFHQRGNCFSGARFKRWYNSLLTKYLKTTQHIQALLPPNLRSLRMYHFYSQLKR